MWPFKKKVRRLVTYVGNIDLKRFPEYAQRKALAEKIHNELVSKFERLFDHDFKGQIEIAPRDGGVRVAYKFTKKDADTLMSVSKALHDLWAPYTVA